MLGLSLVVASWGYSSRGFSLWCVGFSLRWLLSLPPGTQAPVVAALGLCSLDSVAVAHGPHVGSSWTRDQTSVPCVARQTLNHWITREAQIHFFKRIFSFFISPTFTKMSFKRNMLRLYSRYRSGIITKQNFNLWNTVILHPFDAQSSILFDYRSSYRITEIN